MSVQPFHSRCLLSVLTLLAVGCGGAAHHAVTDARVRARVAVLPSVWATETPRSGIDPSASLAAGLEAAGTMEAIEGRAVRDALSAAGEDPDLDCAEDSECVRSVGERLSADRVAALRLASLGTTVMVRVRLMEVEGGAAEIARQTVVEDATAARIRAAIQAIGHELAPAPNLVEEERWYQKWWVWTLVGAVVVGGAAAIAVTALAEGQDPDFVVTPP